MESSTARSSRLASSLIGCPNEPAGFSGQWNLGREAYAYHLLNPYPFFHFQDWKTEERGPLPKAMPIARDIARKGAQWLFGVSPALTAENKKIEEAINVIWQLNMMPQRMVRFAENGAVWGGYCLKFSYDQEDPKKVTISTHNASRDCQLFYDYHDRTRLLMARIQYRYFDAVNGDYYWHREEWTDAEFVQYEPVKHENAANTIENPYDLIKAPPNEKWQIQSRESNKFQVIPVQHVRNMETESQWGEGDCWAIWRVLDRVNLTYHLMDRSNQFDSEPNKVYIDVKEGQELVDRPMTPGEVESVESSNDKGAKVQLLEPGGNLRPAMMEYARELTRQIYSACGSVDIDGAAVTNKGSMTTAVMHQMYAPLINTTREKRKLYGEDGIAKFLELMCIGLKNVGREPAFSSVNPAKIDTYNVTTVWPDFFNLTPEERQIVTQTTCEQFDAGFLSREMAVERIASIEGIDNTALLLEQLNAESANEDTDDGGDTDPDTPGAHGTEPAEGKRSPKPRKGKGDADAE